MVLNCSLNSMLWHWTWQKKASGTVANEIWIHFHLIIKIKCHCATVNCDAKCNNVCRINCVIWRIQSEPKRRWQLCVILPYQSETHKCSLMTDKLQCLSRSVFFFCSGDDNENCCTLSLIFGPIYLTVFAIFCVDFNCEIFLLIRTFSQMKWNRCILLARQKA